MTELETERLQLEPLVRAHAVELFELLSDECLYRFIPQDPFPTREALAARYRRLETRASSDGKEVWLNWAVRLKSSGACIGRVEATVRQDLSAQLAYELGVPHWGKGCATEACRRVLRMLFEEFGVMEVVAEVDTRNLASIRLLDRLGFQRGALKENADVFKGSSSDEWRYLLPRPTLP